MSETLRARAAGARARRPRVGFLGTGWTGRHRMQAMLATEAIEPVAISDPAPEAAGAAARMAPDAAILDGLDALLGRDLDGLVVATPGALNVAQAIAALEQGVAVFCQKPLGRTAAEAAAAVAAARAADRLLSVDLSYRFTRGMQRIREAVHAGALGQVSAAGLVFHYARGLDTPLCGPLQASGGGVWDLGVHLVDLALWVLDFPDVEQVESTLFAADAPLCPGDQRVEDSAVATLQLATGQRVQLACSWRPPGADTEFSVVFSGDSGSAAMRNLRGSFYEFEADALSGAERRPLSRPPDAWGGRAAAHWARTLAAGQGFDPDCARLVQVAETLDRIYGR